MKREARVLLEKAVDSLVLSIEHFNRPWDRGREEVVLILLDRSFELILKGAIVHRGGRIRERRAKETIGLERCVRKCLTESNVKCLDEDQALTIQVINSLRDAAQHYLLETSEQQLYMYAYSGERDHLFLGKAITGSGEADRSSKRGRVAEPPFERMRRYLSSTECTRRGWAVA